MQNKQNSGQVSARSNKVRRERRRKAGDLSNTGINLYVSPDQLDKDEYSYRWVNDTPGRIQSMKNRDWDIVEEVDKPDSNSLGSGASKSVGVLDGKPFNAVLMRKYKDWQEADYQATQKPLDEMDEAIRGGKKHLDDPEMDRATTYTPNEVNTIS